MIVNICDVCGKQYTVCSGGKITVTDYKKMKDDKIPSMEQLDLCDYCFEKVNRALNSMKVGINHELNSLRANNIMIKGVQEK